MHSIRIQFISFITALLLVLLLLLNIYPLTSSRDAVFEEKRSSMTAQASTLASSLSGLERLNPENITEVLRYLDLSGYTRVLVADRSGGSLYDSAGQAGGQIPADLLTCLTGKTVFRSSFREAAFLSSIAIPLSAQGELTGALYLAERDEERAEMLLGFQNRIRAASLAIGALALVLALVYVFLLVNRIRAIVRSMRVVAGGDYSYRHVNRGRDEISELGEEFNQLTERLETTEEQRRRFVSDASHELKTPLASIRLLADSIVQNENVDAATMREFVTDIGNEAKRLQRTTDKLLTLSRLDDSVERELVSVDVKQVHPGHGGRPVPHRLQSGGKRREIQCPRRGGAHRPAGRRKAGDPRCLRHGDRHPRGGPGEYLLPLLSGGQGPLPGGRGQRPGTQYCTRHGAGSGRQYRSRSKYAAGIGLHRVVPPAKF